MSKIKEILYSRSLRPPLCGQARDHNHILALMSRKIQMCQHCASPWHMPQNMNHTATQISKISLTARDWEAETELWLIPLLPSRIGLSVEGTVWWSKWVAVGHGLLCSCVYCCGWPSWSRKPQLQGDLVHIQIYPSLATWSPEKSASWSLSLPWWRPVGMCLPLSPRKRPPPSLVGSRMLSYSGGLPRWITAPLLLWPGFCQVSGQWR